MKEVNNNSETALLLDPIHITATIKWNQFGCDWVLFTHLLKYLSAIGIDDAFKYDASQLLQVYPIV